MDTDRPIRGGDRPLLLPGRLDPAALARIENRTQVIGRDLLARSQAALPSVLSSDYWAEQAGEWVLADDEVKVRLFRLVDCMPMLDDPAAVDRHLREYLDDDTLEKLPAILRTALKAARNGLLAPFAARMVRTAMLAQAKRFIAGTPRKTSRWRFSKRLEWKTSSETGRTAASWCSATSARRSTIFITSPTGPAPAARPSGFAL